MTETEIKKPDHNELVRLFTDGERVDSDLFAEQRSNILIVAGDHYTRRQSKHWNRIRDSRELTNEQKIRITKNHAQRIIKTFENNILTYAPGTTIDPRSENEPSDMKAAQLNKSCWLYIQDTEKFAAKKQGYAKNYCEIGETATKVFWDWTKGKIIGYELDADETGNPILDEFGRPQANKNRPVYAGGLVFEDILPMNLIRASWAKTMDESPFLGIRKMVEKSILKKRYRDDEDKLKLLECGKDETYKVFDGISGEYKNTETEVYIREMYYRPCPDYPRGYFYIFTNSGILEEGELPLGIFPIFYCGWDSIQTTPRHRGHVKVIRPNQIEINRAASKVAEHQITLGDDKLITNSQSKITQGASVPGVRSIHVNGASPIVLPGRTGEQYIEYINANIAEMYQLSFLDEDKVEKNGDLDPYAMLFRSLKQRKYFSIYVEKFERFLIEITDCALRLFKEYATDYHIIPAIGAPEVVNIPELKKTDDLSFQIKIDAQTDDLESKMGKQLTFNHILQYVGPNMTPDQIGKVIRSMPFANVDEAFGDFTLDYDNAMNDILALDRGEMPVANKYDDSKYIIKKLTNRMRKADFKYLQPPIQQNYQMYLNQHMELEAQKQREIAAAEADFIPTGGYMVAADIYISDPKQPDKLPKRARIPYESLQWLIQRLEDQGQSFSQLQSIGNKGAVADIAAKVKPPSPQAGQQALMANGGMAIPQGAQWYAS